MRFVGDEPHEADASVVTTVDYPSSDGRPMAESDAQRIPLTDTVERLGQHFRDRDDVYVTGNHHDEPRERAGPVAVSSPRRRRRDRVDAAAR